MSVLTWILSKLFTYVLFPLVVLGTFAALVLAIVMIVVHYNDQKEEEGAVRAVIAAAVPVVVVVFLHVTSDEWLKTIGSSVASLSMPRQIFSGALVGVALAESAHRFHERLGPLYTLVLSGIAMFMVLLFMNAFLLDASFILFGLVVAAALYTSLFRGLP